MTVRDIAAATMLVEACRLLGWDFAYSMPRRSRALPRYVVLATPRQLVQVKRQAPKLDLRLIVETSKLRKEIPWTKKRFAR